MKTRTLLELTRYLQQLLGDDYAAFAEAPMEPPALRINTLKSERTTLLRHFERWGVSARPHPVNPDGLVLEEDRLPLSHTLAFFAGAFAYQGLSSQLPVLALDPRPGERVLDLCAAPGSKSTQIAALMQNRGQLLLNDSSGRRLQPLMANLFSAGVLNSCLLNLPGQSLGRHFPEQFDRVLVDAPCSALSNLPTRAFQSQWSPTFLEKISGIQEQLLISGIKTARIGGVIVYSTCSICPEEDERVLERILSRYPVELETIPFSSAPCCRPPLTAYQGHTFPAALQRAVRIHPWPLPFEGFFIARLRKTGPLPIRPVTETMPWVDSLTAGDPAIAPLLDHLETLWGLPVEALHAGRFLRTQHRLWILAPEWERLPQRTLMMAGLPLAHQKTNFWRLTTPAIQRFSDQALQPVIEFSDTELKELFREGRLPAPAGPLRYHILQVGGRNLAAVAQSEGFYRIHLPHRFTLVL
ncbi:MAG TPA: RsmB/NOP family class I SAM-dependent RNA methyltransferase [bacterium]|nr:RsmB/NOP family class I SAM-dependent RNA methyltransferase [bacterium]HQI49056.1 RsmB/NOP family class I SAM-dependent RNA methyltransferase [bacterium]HQJ65205.1 RsmB/NOP family class I SAM-dependent RNA methyltransferase [bacterium]